MRKILSFVTSAFIIVGLISACNSSVPQQKVQEKPKPTASEVFLKKTKKQLQEFIKDNTYNPDAVKISDMSTAFLCDSACALNFRMVTENKIGGHVNAKVQYILLRFKGEYFQSIQTDKHDTPHCIGNDNWLGEVSNLMASTLFTKFEDDEFVKSRATSNSVETRNTDKYLAAYCIVQEFGERVPEYNK